MTTRTAPSIRSTAPAVVLLHSFASHGPQDWPAGRWIQPLANTGREVLVVDLLGHGANPALAAGDDATTTRMLDGIAAALR